MAFRKIEAGLVHAPVDEFIGKTGTIFYDNDLGDFRISDGQTPGGIALSFGGGGGGGTYTLPTATTTVKGGVKIDGSTITINNQVISVGTVPYSNLSGAPTIPSNTNQLTNGAGYITSGALSGYATESYVTGRGYITSSALTGLATESYVTSRGYITTSALSGYALTSAIPTNTNQLTNGAGFITSSALTSYATETYVTTRGYLTAVSWNDISSKPTFATVATSGSYADLTNKPTLFSGSYADLTNKPTLFSGSYADLTNKPTLFSGSYADLTNKPTIPTDINQLTDASGLLGQGGGGGGTTYITNNVENPYSFSIAGDDSTLREISNGESIKITGAGGITVTTDDEGKVTITGATVDLTGYATESYVTGQGYITSSALTGYALTADIPTDNNQLTNGSGYITSSALTGLATESYVTSRGYITGLSWNDLSDKPNLAGTYSWSIAADDSTLREINTDETVKFIGAGGITTASDSEGNITITGPSLSGLATETFVTSQGYITGLSWDQITNKPNLTTPSWNDLTDKPNLAGTYTWSIAADDSTQLEIGTGNLVKIQGAGGITTALDADGNITVTGAPGIIVSATAPADTTGKLWFNSVDSRTYVNYNDTWVDASPPVVPQVSTYLDGLVVEGTTITTAAYDDTDIKIHNLTFSDNGVIHLPVNGDIVDSEGNSVLTGLATEEFVNNALANSGIIVSATAPAGQPEGKLWYNSASLELYVRYDNAWVAASASFSGDYNDLTNKPTSLSQFANDANYVSRDEVYLMILELTG